MTLKGSASAPAFLLTETNGWREARLKPIPLSYAKLSRPDESLAALKADKILQTSQTAEHDLGLRWQWEGEYNKLSAGHLKHESTVSENIAHKAVMANKRAEKKRLKNEEFERQSRQVPTGSNVSRLASTSL